MKCELLLSRDYKKPGWTIGNLFINGTRFCNTLEDVDRGLNQNMPLAEIEAKKKYGETAIPTGRYKVVLSWSPKMKRILPEILNIPGWKGVRIHRGNKAADTLGCPLVGENKERGKVLNSTVWEKKLMTELKKYSEIYITIK